MEEVRVAKERKEEGGARGGGEGRGEDEHVQED